MPKLNPFYGEFGGMFVPEILVPSLLELENTFLKFKDDKAFKNDFQNLLNNYAGRPTPLTLCRNLTQTTKSKIYLKREDLLHGGAHKTNQVIGQALLCQRMGKKEVIAETGAGQHGVATAMVCALLGLKCRIYMGRKDCERQRPNLFRMQLLGATVIPVDNGEGTLKDACNEALRDWSLNYKTAHYLLGTAAGPHPFPHIVCEFQKMIGQEAKVQIQKEQGRLPDAVIACVGGGSNAIGIFHDFLQDKEVKLVGVEPAGKGLDTKFHGAPIHTGKKGVFFGMHSYLMQENDGQIKESYSISAGLDFPSVGPEHAYLASIGRAEYVSASDAEALNAFQRLCQCEGIIPALESAHALAHALKMTLKHPQLEQVLLVNLSGRGDKDLVTVAHALQTGEKK